MDGALIAYITVAGRTVRCFDPRAVYTSSFVSLEMRVGEKRRERRERSEREEREM